MEHNSDLPLSSNFHKVKVQHFILDMACSISKKEFDCELTLFCKMSSNTDSVLARTHVISNTENSTQLECLQKQELYKNICNVKESKTSVCLDCFALDISSCVLYPVLPDTESFISTEQGSLSGAKLQIPHTHMDYYHNIYMCLHTQQVVSLEFTVTEHSVLISLPYIMDGRDTAVLKICYRTQAKGPSLLWTVDQCGRPCVFTVGHLLNNRSLFPCQDLPQAMSTWHCSVTLTDSHTEEVAVVMTGEAVPDICLNANGEKVFHFLSSYPVPASTFALAIGTWSVTEINNPSLVDNPHPDRFVMPHCRLFSPACLHEAMVVQLGKYLPLCFEALSSVLGPFPLKHLDILLVPQCFDSLGLASPHLMFLSQSLLCPDLSMLYRLSHEVCHTWFGILTGPKDWTEEWLTEGICCYLEDIIHAAVMQWNEEETCERSTVRALLKFRILASEMDNTSEDLQILRPNMGLVTNTEVTSAQQQFVKNGLNQEKTVTQVHYLKGFFLLRYLEHIAGKEIFLQTLRSFTSLHLGKLFSSQELLDFFFEHCPNLSISGLTATEVCHEWLDKPGMPNQLKDFPTDIESRLVAEVKIEIAHITAAASRKRQRSQKAPAQTNKTVVAPARRLLPEQLILLLETLVEEAVVVSAGQLKMMRETHNIGESNAEVKHSWCDFVIHRKATQWIADVENFLLHHQALGVYLYGELLISKHKMLRNLAYKCYNTVQADMPEGPKTVLQAMLFPA
ncbi:unnamed protein product [Candidula unifasciata]|uniref:Peptidase M1 leukotriene A4 hydrolase/aminopeptidase C-terminal domain-containing protein n=1 Tax=Candidula unifasciata TaxID=100452 RepID=A0A8S3YNU6_9EUPU|nr:unnamed protein product [Candidula unifasciata]